MTKFTIIREDFCESICVSLYYNVVDRPVGNQVRSTVYFNWLCDSFSSKRFYTCHLSYARVLNKKSASQRFMR